MMPEMIKHTSRNVIFMFMTIEKVYSIFIYKTFSNIFFRAKKEIMF